MTHWNAKCDASRSPGPRARFSYEIEVHILCKHNFINTVIHMLSKLSHKVLYSLGSRWICSESEL